MNIRIPFWRGEGCANTFIVFDLIESPELFTEHFIQKALLALLEEGCDDALILLPTQEPATFIMKVLEPDGSFAQFCGNGSRVVAAYLSKRSEYQCSNGTHADRLINPYPDSALTILEPDRRWDGDKGCPKRELLSCL